MEFHVRIAATPVDVEAIEAGLLALDPAGLIDLDPASRLLRVSTLMAPDELATVLAAAGYPVALNAIEQQPSVCCGGCGG